MYAHVASTIVTLGLHSLIISHLLLAGGCSSFGSVLAPVVGQQAALHETTDSKPWKGAEGQTLNPTARRTHSRRAAEDRKHGTQGGGILWPSDLLPLPRGSPMANRRAEAKSVTRILNQRRWKRGGGEKQTREKSALVENPQELVFMHVDRWPAQMPRQRGTQSNGVRAWLAQKKARDRPHWSIFMIRYYQMTDVGHNGEERPTGGKSPNLKRPTTPHTPSPPSSPANWARWVLSALPRLELPRFLYRRGLVAPIPLAAKPRALATSPSVKRSLELSTSSTWQQPMAASADRICPGAFVT